MEQALRQEIAAPGTALAAINVARLNAIIQKLPPDAETIMEFKGDSLALRCGATRATLATIAPDEFPAFRDHEYAATFSMEAETLATMLDRVRAMMSVEQTRYYLCGVNLAVVERDGVKVLRATATNGNDLAMATLPLPDGAAEMPPPASTSWCDC